MTSAKRAVLTLRSFTLVGIPQQREAVRSLGFGAPGPAAAGRLTLKSPPGNHGKEDQTTVAAFLPWRGL